MTNKKGAGALTKALIILSAVILINPNLNIIDILPDFIAYFILAGVVRKYAPLAPYFEEVREGLFRLGIINLVRLPMIAIMFANMSSGSDIIPLMTLIFVVVEAIVLYPLIGNLFNALFYLGERSSNTVTLAPIKVFGLNLSVDMIRAILYIFITIKLALNLIPELCLLTSTVGSTVLLMRKLYPILEVTGLITVLIAGILTLVVVVKYIGAIARSGGLYDAACELAGDKRLERLGYERAVEKRLFGITLLFIASLLLFDVKIALDSASTTDLTSLEVNLLPRCLYALVIMFAIPKISERRGDRIFAYVVGSLYSVATVLTTVMTVNYNNSFSYADLIKNEAAKSAYTLVMICEVAELLLFILFMSNLALAMLRFVGEHTSILERGDKISRMDVEYSRKIKFNALSLALFPAIIAILKTINAYIAGNPQYIYSNPDDITMPIIVASSVPWFSLLLLVVTLAYVFFAFITTGEIKNEIKLKYSNEDSKFN